MKNCRYILAAGAAGLMTSVPMIGESAEQRPPNFVVIFTDDQGYQDVGCFGSPDIATPHLDRMAADGMRFTDFYVAAALCTPSRAALLTGKYAKRLGPVKTVLNPSSQSGISPQEITIAGLLKQKNYVTACIGKWHLGHRDEYLPTANGFDTFYGIPYSNDMWLAPELKTAKDIRLLEGITLEQMNAMRSEKATPENSQKVPLMRNNEIIEFPADQTTLTRRYAEETVRFIEQNKDKPFFVYFTPAMPHIPLFASETFKGRSKAGLYGDTVEEIDWAVGQILQCLEKQGLTENTLVIFTSDNGPWLTKGENGGHALPLRDGKGSTFEGGMRVPCIMKMPGTIPAGTVYSEPVATLDLLPTFGKLAGLPVTHGIDGFDISAVLKGTPGSKTPRDFFLYYRADILSAIRMGDWKLILRVPVGKPSNDPFDPQLYNLKSDIGETNNLCRQHPEIVERLLKRARIEDEKLSP